MPQTPHTETHFTGGELVRDIVTGMSDLVPLSPHILASKVHAAFVLSVAVTLIALFIFGFVKARYTGAPTLRGVLQTLVIGALAAGAAYLIARWIS